MLTEWELKESAAIRINEESSLSETKSRPSKMYLTPRQDEDTQYVATRRLQYYNTGESVSSIKPASALG